MRKIVLLICCLQILCILSKAQNLDYLFGYPEYDHIDYGTAMIHFDEVGTINSKLSNISVPFEGSTALIKDKNGEILVFTNGCSVFNKNGLPIINGEGLNPGELHDIMCTNYGYPVPEGTAFLSKPKSKNLYYLIHLGISEDPDQSFKNGPLYYSVIEIDTLSEQHKVIEKNSILSTGNIESYDIVRHANGRDWWMVVSKFPGNDYEVYLITASGIKLKKTQTLGGNFNLTCKKGTGNIKFSNQGEILVRWNPKCGIKLFTFDRCSGELAIKNEKELKLGGRFGGGGITFTKNDKYVYVNSQLVLYRINLSELESAKLDTFESATNHWGLSLERSFLGIDDNIYFTQMTSSKILPFLKNVEADAAKDVTMNFKDLLLSSLSARTSPHVINLMLGKIPGSFCDSLVSTNFLIPKQSFTIQPNPTKNSITISLKTSDNYKLIVSNTFGQPVLTKLFNDNSCTVLLDGLPSGIYYITVKNESGYWVEKVVKE